MKNSKTCPTCNSTEIYTNAGMNRGGDRSRLPVRTMSNIHVAIYLCLNCGYAEDFIEDDDLKDEKKMNILKEKFKKL